MRYRNEPRSKRLAGAVFSLVGTTKTDTLERDSKSVYNRIIILHCMRSTREKLERFIFVVPSQKQKYDPTVESIVLQ